MAIAIVQGEFQLRPEDREQFLASSVEGMRASRSEDGCLEYLFAADPLDSGRVVLCERWESMEHLDRHIRGLADRRGQQDARPAPLSQEVIIYEVATSRPIG